MPLIQVNLRREVFAKLHTEMSQAIQDAQVETLGTPADDLFQVFIPHGPDEIKYDAHYNDVERTDLVLIRVTAVHMHSVATKQAFFANVVDKLDALGVSRENVLICLTENGFEDWYAGRI